MAVAGVLWCLGEDAFNCNMEDFWPYGPFAYGRITSSLIYVENLSLILLNIC